MSERRQEIIDGLREAADFIEANPDVPVWGEDEYQDSAAGSIGLLVPAHSGDEIADVARALGKADKAYRAGTLRVTRTFGPVELGAFAARDRVCTRKVVGTETVEVEEIVEPAVVETVEVEREIVEWECEPLLKAAP